MLFESRYSSVTLPLAIERLPLFEFPSAQLGCKRRTRQKIFRSMPISTSGKIDLKTHRHSFKSSSAISSFDSHHYIIWLSKLHPWEDMFPFSSSLGSIFGVLATTTATGIDIEVPDGPSAGRDAEGEALPPLSVWH